MAAPPPSVPGTASAVATFVLLLLALPAGDGTAVCVPALALEGGAGSLVVTPASASVGAESASTERVDAATPPADLAVETLCLTAGA